jgi:Holliday junction resolvase-like predicted endonuclease
MKIEKTGNGEVFTCPDQTADGMKLRLYVPGETGPWMVRVEDEHSPDRTMLISEEEILALAHAVISRRPNLAVSHMKWDTAVSTAARYLADSGLEVADQNWTNRDGTGGLTLIAVEDDHGRDVLVIVYVKQAYGDGQYHGALEAFAPGVADSMRELARQWALERAYKPASARIDVIGVRSDGTVDHARGVA